MTTQNDRRQLATEAKAIVALAFRNGPIEAVHAGRLCPTCSAAPGYSRITDPEMKTIMKNAVDRIYALLWLKRHDPDAYAREIALGVRYTANWDEPAGSG